MHSFSIRGPFRGKGSRSMPDVGVEWSELNIKVAPDNKSFPIRDTPYTMCHFVPELTSFFQYMSAFRVPCVLVCTDHTEQAASCSQREAHA